ncbi:bestrophin family protein [Formosa sp. PL04]|uniref:bestrophin family protein n=1 Tax=Formosa sp. PL04 TaxID=3081755 RepID=UPI0029821DC2|nr:bestrophin family ion channel [Formosa sp. PL04]MDW5288917.1 bestrophin family ion channel [Formosa sp. PL04]
MIARKGIGFKSLIKWSGGYYFWLSIFNGIIALLYQFEIIRVTIPWLPVSVIGTAVAFYVGFKNNSAYERLWEARKGWGGIVNESRTWGMLVDSYINNQNTDKDKSDSELHEIKKRLIYRHIAWLYSHRSQLLIHKPWEHLAPKGKTKITIGYFRKNFGTGLLDDGITKEELKLFLPEDEYDRLINYANTATHIINEQSRDLQKLRKENLINDFRLIQMEDVLRSFYKFQGMNERIKSFPLPRQYSSLSHYFVAIFILLLPFSMIPELMTFENWIFWFSVPITSLIGWVYIMMELVGDSSENPFQGLINDIPMMSICRTIEIDLKEMLHEKDLPEPIKIINGVLN